MTMKNTDKLLEIDRRKLISGAFLATLGLSTHPVYSQQKSVNPIEMIVPGGPGAGTDMVARVVAKELSSELGRPIIIKNIPGAAGTIAAQAAARSKPDGNTLFFAITGTQTVNQFLIDKLSYDPIKDFAPVSLVCKYNNVLVVRPDFPAKNLKDIIDFVKNSKSPPFYGITLVGSSSHLAMELLKSAAGLEMNGIPYKSAASAVSDFLGGQFPFLMDTVINQLPHIQAGKVVPVITTGLERSPSLKDVPTMSESGFPGLEAIGWAGVMAPAGTPDSTIIELSSAMKKVMQSSAFDGLIRSGLEIAYTSPSEMGNFIKTESEKWGNLIKKANIKSES